MNAVELDDDVETIPAPLGDGSVAGEVGGKELNDMRGRSPKDELGYALLPGRLAVEPARSQPGSSAGEGNSRAALAVSADDVRVAERIEAVPKVPQDGRVTVRNVGVRLRYGAVSDD